VVADRLMAAVRQGHFETTSAKLAATISIGGVALPDRANSAEEAMAHALQALDRARRRRIESFVAYEAGPEEEKLRRRNQALANALISALDEQRMVLELQPMVCAATGKPDHYECLLRMINLDGSRVSAGDFMPIAEQLGLSRLIDLRSQQLAIGLLHQYRDLHVSLNVSGLTSGDNEWLVSLHRLTGGQRSITKRLTIEITETAAIHDLDQTMVFVDTIKDLGCKAAIDDFGVGYTNFRNLKLLNADLVKIDGAFVKNVCQDKGDQVFIKSMVELARAFGMKTVAEWVGDEATSQFLIAAGIDYLQGFYYGAPANPDVFLGPPRQE
jgi:EAL domain-containing protein (putative c-di-GMP-specific phosphodiesterase class I)